MKEIKSKLIKNIIYILTFFAISFNAMFFFSEAFEIDYIANQSLQQSAKSIIGSEEKSLEEFVSDKKSVLTAIYNSSQFKNYLQKPNQYKDILIEDFKILADSETQIMQLRYLDVNGQEQIRIDTIFMIPFINH